MRNAQGHTSLQQAQRVKRNYKRHLRRKYGITFEDYELMIVAQEGKCLICEESPERLYVDHDHSTGEIRGLLCNQCNLGLGGFRDDVRLLRKAAQYLERVGRPIRRP